MRRLIEWTGDKLHAKGRGFFGTTAMEVLPFAAPMIVGLSRERRGK